ncbi:MAG TPA: SUMF1/EgtB/PvdO family nonheme iron enzyme [Terriglobales bacterium]|nr:SUMF1/EgtB/PvdO family nonheme iron enzyme [Terriglobales bacterium]
MPTTSPLFLQPKLAQVPAGWFLMGSDAGQENERPVHRVWVSAFELAARQVTNLEFSRYLEATGAQPPVHWKDPQFSHPQQPVVAVSWFEAAAYCEWLTHCAGRRYRLPTEAEWERAARGGREGALYPWGDEPPQSRPGYAERWLRGPEPVGRQAPSDFGLHDICDNVHEWCSDWFDPEYYAASPERDPQGPAEGARRASRGGSWRHHVKVARCAARSSIPPHFQYADYGFRVAAAL